MNWVKKLQNLQKHEHPSEKTEEYPTYWALSSGMACARIQVLTLKLANRENDTCIFPF